MGSHLGCSVHRWPQGKGDFKHNIIRLSCLQSCCEQDANPSLGFTSKHIFPQTGKFSFLPWAISSEEMALWANAVWLQGVQVGCGTCWLCRLTPPAFPLSCKIQLQAWAAGWIYALLRGLASTPARSLALFPAARIGDECRGVSALSQTLPLFGDWWEGAAGTEKKIIPGGKTSDFWFTKPQLSFYQLVQCVERSLTSPLTPWVSYQP